MIAASLGADSVVELPGGGFRLVVGGKTVAYAAELGRGRGVRLRVLAESLPVKLTRGLKVEPIASKRNLSVWVAPAQVARVRPILEHVARVRAKS